MIGRRSVAGLSLLCALFFCAFAAQSASAKGTTAFTCAPNGGAKDFSDAHCDNPVTPGTGSFGHVAITTETLVQLTNDKTKNNTTEHTPFVFKVELALAPARITCTHANGEAKLINEEVGGVMQTKGQEGGFLNLTTCTVQEPLNCTVKEPIVWEMNSITRTNINTNEMGVEFKPPAGSTAFASITYEGASCGLKGKTFKVEGTMIATGRRGSTEAVTSSGATLEFTNAMTKTTLKTGGKPAELEGTLTLAMTNASKETENAITLTTTAN
jgi:hypothetical protein